MSAEITKLTRQKTGEVINGEMTIVDHNHSNGRILRLDYLFGDFIKNNEGYLGRLHVHELGTSIDLSCNELKARILVVDQQEGGYRLTFNRRQILERNNQLKLDVIETEIWRRNIGIRIKHLSTK